MKIHRLNQAGFSHYLLPVLVVVIVGLIGARVITASHAAGPTTLTFTPAAATPTTSRHVAILGPSNTVGGQAAQSSVPYSFIGYQTVNYLGPGQSLTYNQGVKGNEKSCYELYVEPPQTGTATATVEFANNNNYEMLTLTSNPTDNLQQVCVPAGTLTNPGFNVENQTPSQQNTTIEVFEDVMSW